MATTPYPLPREKRESTIDVGNGTAGPYGPSGFKVFDVADVAVFVRPAGAEFFTDAPVGTTVIKTSGQPFDTFSVTFPVAVPPTTDFIFQSRRVHERATAVTKGGAISAGELERELSKQGSVLDELRRDIDRSVRVDPGQVPLKIKAGVAGELMAADVNGNVAGAGENVASILGSTAQAVASAVLAQEFATKGEDQPISGFPALRSAFHWAQKAAASTVGNIGAAINSLAGKATPVDNDKFVLADSAAAWISKAITWGQIKAALQLIFLEPAEVGSMAFESASTYLSKSGGTLTGALTLAADPAANLQPATKQYVDSFNIAPKIAALAYGAVGTYVMGFIYGTGITDGSTYAGSNIQPAGAYLGGSAIANDGGSGASGIDKGGTALSGTWRAMGRLNNTSGSNLNRITLFMRIS